MKKHFVSSLILVSASCGLYLLLGGTSVHAQSFDYTDHLMDDSVYTASGTMTAPQIQTLLQNEGSGLAGFSDIENCGSTSGSNYSYYATYYSCGKAEPASKIIYDAAHAYGINPQVILATMEKEQSLVTTPNPTASQLNYAMGYGCPDSGGCSYAGFFNQVDNATWQFKFNYERLIGNSTWWNSSLSYPCSGATRYYSTGLLVGNNVTFIDDYGDHYANFTLPDASTASLYCYTPHVYPGSSREYYSGSYNFVYYYNLWFTPYSDTYYAESGYPTLDPGQQSTAWVEYQNNGYETWYDDSSIGSASSGSYAIHLSTARSLNRNSMFGSAWPSYSRPATTFAAVYESDGSTLAANQHVVQPGQIVKFSFTITAPTGVPSGTYQEYFQPVAEGSPTGALNDPGTFLNITINAIPNVGYWNQSSYPTIVPATSSSAYLMLRNSGSTPLYDDNSISTAPSGSYPVHLATSNPLNSSSAFSASWPSANRAANSFSAVYNTDGMTLAGNQHVALPGQIILFKFDFSIPAQYTANSYQQYLQPVLEGTSNGYFPDLGVYWNIIVPSTAVFAVTNNTPNLSLAYNQPGQVSLSVTNDGNASADSSTVLTTTNASYQSPSWASPSQVMNVSSGSIAPGGTTSLSVPILAPGAALGGNTFACSFSDNSTVIPLSNPCQTNISLSQARYQDGYIGESNFPTLTYGQTTQVYFMYKNTGNQPWYDDSSIGTATWRNATLLHLATAQPLNRISGFNSSWPAPNRPATTFAAVYESDGVTLAANQHLVQPGQIVKFSLTVSPQSWVGSGITREYFSPVVEGSSNGLINNPGTFLDFTVLPYTYQATYSTESPAVSLSPGQQATVYLNYKNTGNATWYDDTSVSSAPTSVTAYPVHLATSHSLNRASNFSSSWPSSNRPATTFAAVYESDGSTLATNQHVVQPGQIVKFSLTMSVPSNTLSGTYHEYFQPVADGSSSGSFNDPWTFLTITVQ